MGTVGEGVIEGIVWYATDPLGPLPTTLAEMDPDTQARSIRALAAMVDRYGGQGAIDIAAGVADYMADEDS